MALSDAFRLIAAKRLKLPVQGKKFAEIGEDVTEVYKDNKWLSSLIDMGDVVIVPAGNAVTKGDLSVTGTANPMLSSAKSVAGATGETVSGVVVTAPAAAVVTPVAEPNVDAAAEEEDEPVADVIDYMEDPTGYTVEQVLAYAEAHPDHAEMLLDAERDGKGRKSLISALTDIAESAA